ncbi:MAG TPA: phospholipase D-like domain-containing protein [Steroidobacteraceae bacterium]
MTAASASAMPPRRRRARRLVLLALLAAWAGMAVWHTNKPLPQGTHVSGPWHVVPLSEVSFIADITTADAYGRPVISQAIFDEVLAIVNGAREFLVLDFFLFNDHSGVDAAVPPHRPLSRELRDALIARRLANPQLRILLVTDPINDVYGGAPSPDLDLLRAAGVDVVMTDLDALRDSNPIYSALWRLAIAWWSGDGRGNGWLPNPLDDGPGRVTFRAWARLINFKANHRKVIIGDDGRGGLVGIVTSANPHDASSAHSNVAAKVTGPVLKALVASELELARQAGWQGSIEAPSLQGEAIAANTTGPTDDTARVRVLTEGAIREEVLARIQATANGDFIDMAMFYLSDRSIVEALIAAGRRGVNVRLILDPNKDAFGRTKSGIPNRSVASELVSSSDGAVRVRWYRTHGEQFHTKMLMIYDRDRLWLTLGSANFTRRNLADFNLEANLAIETTRSSPLALQVIEYFDTLWNNHAPLGIEYTADFGVYADPTQRRYWLYRIMETTGLSTF